MAVDHMQHLVRMQRIYIYREESQSIRPPSADPHPSARKILWHCNEIFTIILQIYCIPRFFRIEWNYPIEQHDRKEGRAR